MKILVALLLPTLACASTATRPDGGSGLLQPPAKGPELTAYDVNDKATKLSELSGHPVIVYFYPKDGTPGCTKEACAFRDAWKKYQDAGIAIIGVSADSRQSHKEFQQKHNLPFPLVADDKGDAQRGYGVGKKIFGYERVSFLLDKDGKVAKVFPDVDPAIHADEVLSAAKAL